jgi:hypothetical protein
MEAESGRPQRPRARVRTASDGRDCARLPSSSERPDWQSIDAKSGAGTRASSELEPAASHRFASHRMHCSARRGGVLA